MGASEAGSVKMCRLLILKEAHRELFGTYFFLLPFGIAWNSYMLYGAERWQEAEPLTELFGDYLTRCVFSKARPIGQTGPMGFGKVWLDADLLTFRHFGSLIVTTKGPYDNDPQSRN